MSIVNFTPSVWAGSILRALETMLVYAGPGVVNRDYEGDVKNVGDSVRINMLGDVTVGDYTKDADMNAPETLSDAQLTLKVDQQKYFNFQLDDIDKRQAQAGLLEEAARRAAYGLMKATDTYVASLYTEISTANAIGTTASPKTDLATASVPYNYLVDLKTLLDNSDTPEEDRFCVIPPWFEGYLLKDSRFVGFGTGPQDARLTNGKVGTAAGFTLYKSNQVPNTTATNYRIIAGHKSAWSHADQILETEAYRPERRFADALKGLHVYGSKVVRPSNLAVLVANPT